MDDPLEKTTELRMHFVSRYMTIEVGSTLFEDLNYLLMYLMLLLLGNCGRLWIVQAERAAGGPTTSSTRCTYDERE